MISVYCITYMPQSHPLFFIYPSIFSPPPPHFVACIWVLTYSRESNSQWSLLAYLAEHLGFGVLRDVVGDLKVA